MKEMYYLPLTDEQTDLICNEAQRNYREKLDPKINADDNRQEFIKAMEAKGLKPHWRNPGIWILHKECKHPSFEYPYVVLEAYQSGDKRWVLELKISTFCDSTIIWTNYAMYRALKTDLNSLDHALKLYRYIKI